MLTSWVSLLPAGLLYDGRKYTRVLASDQCDVATLDGGFVDARMVVQYIHPSFKWRFDVPTTLERHQAALDD